MSESLNSLFGHEVLAIYRCGSSCYDLSLDKSDEDYTVIIDCDDHAGVVKEDGKDYFVFGRRSFKKMLSLDDGILTYFKIWADNSSIAKGNLLYIKEGFEDEFDELLSIDWRSKFKKWLSLNVDYFGFRLNENPTSKTLYNIYKLNSIVDKYAETGEFLSFFNKDDYACALDFKSNEASRRFHKERLNAIIEKLKGYLKEDSL